jgi:hypothetical protein
VGEHDRVTDHQPLDPRYIQLQREVGRILTAVFSVGLLVGLALLLAPRRWAWYLPLWVVGTAAIAWVLHVWPVRSYRHTSYRVDEEGIEIRTGVWWRRVISVPRSRVQHTDVVQGPLARKHGLGVLAIYTAGTDHARVELPGLDHETAVAIRDQLLPRESADGV